MDGSYGRKISEDNEDHIDNMMIEIADRVSPFFKQLNYTANVITTLSLIMSIASIYLCVICRSLQSIIHWRIQLM